MGCCPECYRDGKSYTKNRLESAHKPQAARELGFLAFIWDEIFFIYQNLILPRKSCQTTWVDLTAILCKNGGLLWEKTGWKIMKENF